MPLYEMRRQDFPTERVGKTFLLNETFLLKVLRLLVGKFCDTCPPQNYRMVAVCQAAFTRNLINSFKQLCKTSVILIFTAGKLRLRD